MSIPISARKVSAWHGLFSSGAVFLDEHHLISVRSFGFEEQVKRLAYKDIQAVVVSKTRRFGMSRKLWIAVALVVFGGMIALSAASAPGWTVGALPLAAAAVWLYLSIAYGRTCRLYTAVSQEDLISVRRSWMVAKFFAELTPRIEAAQGALPENWGQLIEENPSPAVAPAISKERELPSVQETCLAARKGRPMATIAMALFLLATVVFGVVNLDQRIPKPAWLGELLLLAVAATAVWVLIEFRGLNAGLQRLGGATLIFLALIYYSSVGFATAARMQTRQQLTVAELRTMPPSRILRQVEIGGCLILAALAILLTIASRPQQRVDALTQ